MSNGNIKKGIFLGSARLMLAGVILVSLRLDVKKYYGGNWSGICTPLGDVVDECAIQSTGILNAFLDGFFGFIALWISEGYIFSVQTPLGQLLIVVILSVFVGMPLWFLAGYNLAQLEKSKKRLVFYGLLFAPLVIGLLSLGFSLIEYYVLG